MSDSSEKTKKNQKQPEKQLDRIKSSVFMRSLSLAKLTLNTGSKLAGHGISTLLTDENGKNEKWQLFLKSQAETFKSELGELKGSLMKAGQMLSMYGEHFLPPEANELLKTLQSKSPPLKWEAILPILEKELGKEKLEKLEIDPESIGSASLGQVHKAKIKATGEWIALKVQYPGVDKAIDSDLRAIKSFLSLLKLLPKNLNMDHVFKEVQQMLIQETNYPLEIEQTERYRDLLKDDARFVVPKVYREFCGEKVIATSFEKGIDIDDPLVKSLSQQRKNRLALNFIDLYFKELFDWGVVQTDPHLGNYKIRLSPDGRDQLVLFDFGAVRKYEDSFLFPYYEMIESSLALDTQALELAAKKLKFVQDDDNPELKKMFENFCLWTVEPFLSPEDPRAPGKINAQGEYDWKNSDLPQRLTKLAFQMIQKFELRPPPREILFLDRKTGGVFIFCGVLGAVINARPLLLLALEKSKSRKPS